MSGIIFCLQRGYRWSDVPEEYGPAKTLYNRCRQVRNWLLKAEATACIPPRKNRKVQFEYDTKLYKTRNIIERMFNCIKDWRQLSLRTFRCPETFLAAAQLAAVVIWLL